MRAVLAIIALLAALVSANAYAHKPSDSYLTLRVDGAHIDGHWDIAVRDLDAVIDLDSDHDGAIRWGEIADHAAEIDRYAMSRLALSTADGACTLAAAPHLIDHHTDGAYIVLPLHGECPAAIDALSVDYTLLFEIDAQHRGLVNLQSANGNTVAAVFPSERRRQTLTLVAASGWKQLRSFVGDGIEHIATGFDHILFLIALLLPAVLRRKDNAWVPVGTLSTAFWNVATTVTAFTLAHSITLSLATLRIVQLPSRFTESAIALTVLLTALDNFVPFLPRRRWIVAFVFGLMHGFGFASVLLDLDLPPSALALSLFGFNAGVEIGQLLLVVLLMPLAFLFRGTFAYRRVALAGGSAVIALMALGWFVERAFNVALMPF